MTAPRRPAVAVLAAVVVLLGLRIGAAPAERCPPVDAGEARAAAERAVGWFAANQHAGGRFRYLVHEDGRDLGGYNGVRHAGVLMSLEQAAAAGIGEARTVADRGTDWALRRLEPAGGGQAMADVDGSIRTGSTALLVRALLQRGGADPSLLEDLGTFLAGQVDEDGAVLSAWDPVAAAPTGAPNPFFTGEAYWALLGLDGFGAAKDRIGAYLPIRDQAEDRFPPISDHWATYSYNAIGWGDLTAEQRAHADRMADLFGVQVRGESTRWKGGLQGTLRGGPAGGSGLGTLGEGTGNLLQLYGHDAPSGLDDRLRCVAGMLVERQAADGAWYTDGVTRMDDQQHALSALLFSGEVLGVTAQDAVGGGEDPHGLVWLIVLGLGFGLAASGTDGRARPPVGRAALGAVLVVVLSGPVLDALDVTPASARAAAGIAAALAALASLVRPEAAVTSGIVGAAVVALALALGADDGAAALVAVVLAAVAAGRRWWARGRWAGWLGAAVLLVLAVDLIVDGILGV